MAANKMLSLYNPIPVERKIKHSYGLFMDLCLKTFICRAGIFLDKSIVCLISPPAACVVITA